MHVNGSLKHRIVTCNGSLTLLYQSISSLLFLVSSYTQDTQFLHVGMFPYIDLPYPSFYQYVCIMSHILGFSMQQLPYFPLDGSTIAVYRVNQRAFNCHALSPITKIQLILSHPLGLDHSMLKCCPTVKRPQAWFSYFSNSVLLVLHVPVHTRAHLPILISCQLNCS